MLNAVKSIKGQCVYGGQARNELKAYLKLKIEDWKFHVYNLLKKKKQRWFIKGGITLFNFCAFMGLFT